MTQDLAFTSAVDQRNAIAKKEVSPVELTKLYLDRIEQLDPHLNSFITVTKTEALETAQKAEDSIMKGEPLGPLHGLPTAIKILKTRAEYLLPKDHLCSKILFQLKIL